MRYFFLYVTALFSFLSFGQELTGSQLLANAISYHDPNNNWNSFNGSLGVTMSTPDGKERVSEITINLPLEFFQVSTLKDGATLKQTMNKGVCELMLNGSTTITDEDKKTYQLNCERANMYKNYYTYLYGLPMKLKDAGTIIDPKTKRKSFKGKEYMVLKVTYEKEVGKDVWYFYFDPNTYAMEIYQFFHDESKNDGEYILLTGEEEVSGIKIPKHRAWYFNKEDKYLGTDVLTNASSL